MTFHRLPTWLTRPNWPVALRGAGMVDAVALYRQFSIVGTALFGVLGVAYIAYHVVLRYKGHGVAKTVWCVGGLWLLTFLTKLMGLIQSEMVSSLDMSQLTLRQVALLRTLGVLSLTFNLMWAFCLLLIAYGFDVVVPTLSDASWRTFKITSLLGLSTLFAFITYVFALFVFDASVVPYMGVFVAVVGIAFVVLFLVRFFQGIRSTMEEIATTSNLIPAPRRIAFEARYKYFKWLSVGTVLGQVLLMVVSLLVLSFQRASEATVGVVSAAISLFALLLFSLACSWLFHATRDESLKLYGAPRAHEIGGFNSLQERDDELFA